MARPLRSRISQFVDNTVDNTTGTIKLKGTFRESTTIACGRDNFPPSRCGSQKRKTPPWFRRKPFRRDRPVISFSS